MEIVPNIGKLTPDSRMRVSTTCFVRDHDTNKLYIIGFGGLFYVFENNMWKKLELPSMFNNKNIEVFGSVKYYRSHLLCLGYNADFFTYNIENDFWKRFIYDYKISHFPRNSSILSLDKSKIDGKTKKKYFSNQDFFSITQLGHRKRVLLLDLDSIFGQRKLFEYYSLRIEPEKTKNYSKYDRSSISGCFCNRKYFILSKKEVKYKDEGALKTEYMLEYIGLYGPKNSRNELTLDDIFLLKR